MIIPEQKPYIKTFPCGLQFVLKKNTSQVAYCALSIKSGTRIDPALYNGLAHFTEHMIFKGTKTRTSNNINNRLEKLGGELNAYTTKEEIVVYCTVLKEDLAKAIDLLFEIVFTSTFPAKELQKERSVVIDEINMYKDSPSEYIFDDFEEFLFGQHPLSKSILGNSKSLNRISSKTLMDFVKTNFTPDKMSFSIVANVSDAHADKLLSKSIGKFVPTTAEHVVNQPSILTTREEALNAGKVFSKEVSKKNHQVNCIIGAAAYSLYDNRRIPLLLLTNILGGPSSNSLLNQALREKGALVYTVEASYNQYSDTGAVTIYFGCDKSNLTKCIELTNKQISKLQEKKISEAMLKSAKKQLLGQIAVSSDNGETLCLSLGKSLLAFGEILPDETIRQKINSVSAEQIWEVAKQIFAKERLSTLIYK